MVLLMIAIVRCVVVVNEGWWEVRCVLSKIGSCHGSLKTRVTRGYASRCVGLPRVVLGVHDCVVEGGRHSVVRNMLKGPRCAAQGVRLCVHAQWASGSEKVRNHGADLQRWAVALWRHMALAV